MQWSCFYENTRRRKCSFTFIIIQYHVYNIRFRALSNARQHVRFIVSLCAAQQNELILIQFLYYFFSSATMFSSSCWMWCALSKLNVNVVLLPRATESEANHCNWAYTHTVFVSCLRIIISLGCSTKTNNSKYTEHSNLYMICVCAKQQHPGSLLIFPSYTLFFCLVMPRRRSSPLLLCSASSSQIFTSSHIYIPYIEIDAECIIHTHTHYTANSTSFLCLLIKTFEISVKHLILHRPRRFFFYFDLFLLWNHMAMVVTL